MQITQNTKDAINYLGKLKNTYGAPPYDLKRVNLNDSTPLLEMTEILLRVKPQSLSEFIYGHDDIISKALVSPVWSMHNYRADKEVPCLATALLIKIDEQSDVKLLVDLASEVFMKNPALAQVNSGYSITAKLIETGHIDFAEEIVSKGYFSSEEASAVVKAFASCVKKQKFDSDAIATQALKLVRLVDPSFSLDSAEAQKLELEKKCVAGGYVETLSILMADTLHNLLADGLEFDCSDVMDVEPTKESQSNFKPTNMSI